MHFNAGAILFRRTLSRWACRGGAIFQLLFLYMVLHHSKKHNLLVSVLPRISCLIWKCSILDSVDTNELTKSNIRIRVRWWQYAYNMPIGSWNCLPIGYTPTILVKSPKWRSALKQDTPCVLVDRLKNGLLLKNSQRILKKHLERVHSNLKLEANDLLQRRSQKTMKWANLNNESWISPDKRRRCLTQERWEGWWLSML